MISDQIFTGYFVSDCGHVVAIDSLEPVRIKAAVRAARRGLDEPDVAHTKLLSAVAQALGVTGGFAAYEGWWQDLQSFMRRHDLRERKDLFAASTRSYIGYTVTREALAERLFCSDQPWPERVFTGHDFDWSPYDGYHREPPERARLLQLFIDISYGFHFLHDLLVSPRRQASYVPCLYHPKAQDPDSIADARRSVSSSLDRFQHDLDQSPDGWLDVVCFSDSIAFLRGRDGAYDLVFRELRSSAPAALFDGHVSVVDVPFAHAVDAWFDDWYARQRGRQRALDSHRAEERYYATVGTVEGYPGWREILRDLLEADRVYRIPSIASVRTAVDGFVEIARPDQPPLHVSPLITIDQLRAFLHESGYAARRNAELDSLEMPNQDAEHLPAAVTWYDALAYARWMQERLQRPVRLLSSDEYRLVHPGVPEDSWPHPDPMWRHRAPEDRRLAEGCLQFVLPDGTVRSEWGQIGPAEVARFKPDLHWRVGAGGIRFLVTAGFGEWLFESTGREARAVHAVNQAGVHDGLPLERDLMPCRSWGMYKCCKIGFRLCYEGEPAQSVARPGGSSMMSTAPKVATSTRRSGGSQRKR